MQSEALADEIIVDVDAKAGPLAAQWITADPSVPLLIIHSGRDRIRVTGLALEHARVVAQAINARPLEG